MRDHEELNQADAGGWRPDNSTKKYSYFWETISAYGIPYFSSVSHIVADALRKCETKLNIQDNTTLKALGERFILLTGPCWPTHHSVQFSSVAQSCPTLCNPMNHSTPGLPVHHQLPEFTQTHVHRVGDVIQPSHPLSSPSPPALNLSQHQGLFKWVNSSCEVAKVLEFQLQHQSLQWTPRTDLL